MEQSSIFRPGGKRERNQTISFYVGYEDERGKSNFYPEVRLAGMYSVRKVHRGLSGNSKDQPQRAPVCL